MISSEIRKLYTGNVYYFRTYIESYEIPRKPRKTAGKLLTFAVLYDKLISEIIPKGQMTDDDAEFFI